ncbi:LPXTG-motif cell wall anchor domain-containing protein [Ignavigranum ruoffiae]|uniref:LPXTG-motif cell wall anchor domain-containing protein n=1 Tax=Ignavigranum ruoffiae TaxID=89093 RepID=A0A1H9G526_9LACT|nr:LPXTG cell wall anchor domain-containing protein [Ignavigranum ruoffiae]SEQ45182.1 LPXTG-motif cell wall anchor domain-containing protein [Ignavigranum ruoffiae]
METKKKHYSYKWVSACAASLILAGALPSLNIPNQEYFSPVVSAQTIQDPQAKVRVDQAEEGAKLVSGQTEANATVTIMVEKTSAKVTVDADAEGNWQAELPEETELVDGDTLNLTVTLTDGEIVSKTITVGLIDHSLTIDEINTSSRQITGQTSPLATVTALYEATGDKWTVDADEAGNFVIELPAELNIEANQKINLTANSTDNQQEFVEAFVEANAEDGASEAETTAIDQETSLVEDVNGTEDATEVTDLEETMADVAPVDHSLEINPIAEGDQIVSGQTSPQATVLVRAEDTGDKWTVDADEQGVWTVELPQSITADQILAVTANSVDNQQAYQEITVEAASQTTQDPSQADTTEAQASFVKVDPVYAGAETISGTTNPGATVLVRHEVTGDKWTTDADEQGNWQVDVPLTLSEGETLAITANSLDNETSYIETGVLAAEATTSQAPVQENFVKVKDIMPGDKMISGTTLPEATVTLLFQTTGDKVSVDADAEGNWTTEVPETVSLKAGNLINVTSNSLEGQQAFVQVKVNDGVTVDKESSVDSKDQLPDTGENKGLWGIVGVVLLALAGAVFFFNRKNSQSMK